MIKLKSASTNKYSVNLCQDLSNDRKPEQFVIETKLKNDGEQFISRIEILGDFESASHLFNSIFQNLGD